MSSVLFKKLNDKLKIAPLRENLNITEAEEMDFIFNGIDYDSILSEDANFERVGNSSLYRQDNIVFDSDNWLAYQRLTAKRKDYPLIAEDEEKRRKADEDARRRKEKFDEKQRKEQEEKERKEKKRQEVQDRRDKEKADKEAHDDAIRDYGREISSLNHSVSNIKIDYRKYRSRLENELRAVKDAITKTDKDSYKAHSDAYNDNVDSLFDLAKKVDELYDDLDVLNSDIRFSSLKASEKISHFDGLPRNLEDEADDYANRLPAM